MSIRRTDSPRSWAIIFPRAPVAQAWSCDSQAPWSKPTVQNTNQRVRRWLPRDTVLLRLPPRALNARCERMNGTPRKCLGFRTPSEVFREQLFTGEHG